MINVTEDSYVNNINQKFELDPYHEAKVGEPR